MKSSGESKAHRGTGVVGAGPDRQRRVGEQEGGRPHQERDVKTSPIEQPFFKQEQEQGWKHIHEGSNLTIEYFYLDRDFRELFYISGSQF